MAMGTGYFQADDAVQAAFTLAWDRWDTIRYPRAWLYKVALRESYRAGTGREVPAGDALPDTASEPDTADLVVLNEEDERVRCHRGRAARPAAPGHGHDPGRVQHR
jgi:RNA polymerase sigma-70 factor (ECF subfamily)